MNKKLLALLSVLVLVSMMLTACGSAQPKTLKIYLLDYTPDTIAWLKSDINPAFEKAHPGVVGIQRLPVSSPLAKVPTSSTLAQK